MLKKAASIVLARSDPRRTNNVRLGPSLTVALLDDLFDHPPVEIF